MLPVKSLAANRCTPLLKATRAFSGMRNSRTEIVAFDGSTEFLLVFGWLKLATGASRHTRQHDATRREVISAPLLGAPDSPENHGVPKSEIIFSGDVWRCKNALQLLCRSVLVKELFFGTGEPRKLNVEEDRFV